MVLLLLKIIITNVFFSVIICSLFVRLNKNNKHSNLELLLHSLGLGPALTTLLLYYSFLIFPHHSHIFYFSLIFVAYCIIAIGCRKFLKQIYKDILNFIKDLLYTVRNNFYRNIWYVVVLSLLFFAFALYLCIYVWRILPQPLYGHDILGYGIMGRIIFNERSLLPIRIEDFANNGFLYQTLHAPSFSLLLTWEEFFNTFFSTKSDLYLKSISTYYGLLIVSAQYYCIAKRNKWLAILSTISLLSGFVFFLSFLSFHIDTYRIFFLTISWVYLSYTIKEKDFLSLLMLGIFSGFAVYTHSIGTILVVVNCLAVFIFLEDSFKNRLMKTVLVVMLTIIFGGIHYFVDIFWGRGWIFKVGGYL